MLNCVIDMQPVRKRARKSHDDETGPSEIRTVAKRKGKGRLIAGSLAGLMNMPLDVFFEVRPICQRIYYIPPNELCQIASHLHPLDMLNLSRTSKSLRSLVLAKSSRSAWIASLATVDALPACPTNMSEPSYAALLFDRHCSVSSFEHQRQYKSRDSLSVAVWVDQREVGRLCNSFETLQDVLQGQVSPLSGVCGGLVNLR